MWDITWLPGPVIGLGVSPTPLLEADHMSATIILTQSPFFAHVSYPSQGFKGLTEAREWVKQFVRCYNEDHRQGINEVMKHFDIINGHQVPKRLDQLPA